MPQDTITRIAFSVVVSFNLKTSRPNIKCVWPETGVGVEGTNTAQIEVSVKGILNSASRRYNT